MKASTVLIVGGGPAGATCAWKLRQKGVNVRILDRKSFPRHKVCAGWITPEAAAALDFSPDAYPFLLKRFHRIYFHVCGVGIPVNTCQYSVRRYEFDAFMLSRARVPVETHTVRKILKQNDAYIIDDRYKCRYLVGAGGTHCPVRRIFFSRPGHRPSVSLIAAVEKEYPCLNASTACHLWFFHHGLPGYAWYLPKGGGWINIGIGGKVMKLKARDKSIQQHWREFTRMLHEKSLIPEPPGSPRGHTYYLNHGRQNCRRDNAFIIGDAVGLATLDMGEGIRAAIESGLAAAAAISDKTPFSPYISPKFSLPGMLLNSGRSFRGRFAK